MSEPKLYRILQITFIAIIIGLLIASAFLFASGERLRRWYMTAFKAINSRDYATAITYYERYLHERPFDSDTWADLALAYFHSGQYDACIAALESYEGGVFSWADDEEEDARLRQEHLESLIRYVRCVAAGENFGEKRPLFFSLYARDDPNERGDEEDVVGD